MLKYRQNGADNRYPRHLSRIRLHGVNTHGFIRSLSKLDNAFTVSEKIDIRQLEKSRNRLVRANLSQADLQGINLAGGNLNGARLNNAYLMGANLMGVDLGNANLANANLRGAHLAKANLEGANLRGTYLKGVDLSLVTNLKSSQLEQANTDASTKLPEYLLIKPEEIEEEVKEEEED